MLFRGDICPRTYVRDVLEWHGKTGIRGEQTENNKTKLLTNQQVTMPTIQQLVRKGRAELIDKS